MLQLLTSAQGEKALKDASMSAARYFESRLETGELGDTKIWVDIALLGPNGAYLIGDILRIGNGRPTLGQEDECTHICEQQRLRSIRLNGLSCRDAEEIGDTRRDDETYHTGNVVVDLSPGGTYKLIVSGAGPHDRSCEEICTFIAEIIVAEVQKLLRDPEPTLAPVPEYVG